MPLNLVALLPFLADIHGLPLTDEIKVTIINGKRDKGLTRNVRRFIWTDP